MAKKQLVKIEHGREPEQKNIMHKLATKGICPFCPEGLPQCNLKNLRYYGYHWIVADSGFPYEGANVHILFIAQNQSILFKNYTHPKQKHRLDDGIPDMVWGELFHLAQRCADERKLKGWTLVLRCGDMNRTCASVQHLHAHLIAGNATSAMQRRGTAEYLLVPVGYKKKPKKR